MVDAQSVVLFGVKSPLVVEYEETLLRLGLSLAAGVMVEGPSRLMARDKVVALDSLDPVLKSTPAIPCAFATSNRRVLLEQLEAAGFALHPGLVDPNAVVAASCRLGAGAFVNAGAVIGGATRIGRCAIVNRNASVGHHCILSDFVSIGPAATLASNARVGQMVTIGAGATVLPDVKIGDGAVVAGGSMVRKDVEAGQVVAGNPAKPLTLAGKDTKVWSNAQE